MVLEQSRLVVERVHVGDAARHVQKDDSLCLGGKVRLPRGQWVNSLSGCGVEFLGQHGVKREPSESAGGSLKDVSS